MSTEPPVKVRCVGFDLEAGHYELRLFHNGCDCVTPIHLSHPGIITVTLTGDERVDIKRIENQHKDQSCFSKH